MSEPMTLHVPQKREYFEVTLYFKGGVTVVACLKEFKTKTDSYSGQYTSFEWENTEWDDLPKLNSLSLRKLRAITTKKIKEIK